MESCSDTLTTLQPFILYMHFMCTSDDTAEKARIMLTSHHKHCAIVACSHMAPPARQVHVTQRRRHPRQLGEVKHLQVTVLLVNLITKAVCTTHDHPTALQGAHTLQP